MCKRLFIVDLLRSKRRKSANSSTRPIQNDGLLAQRVLPLRSLWNIYQKVRSAKRGKLCLSLETASSWLTELWRHKNFHHGLENTLLLKDIG